MASLFVRLEKSTTSAAEEATPRGLIPAAGGGIAGVVVPPPSLSLLGSLIPPPPSASVLGALTRDPKAPLVSGTLPSATQPLVDSIKAHYGTVNPLFAETEQHVRPVQSTTVEHSGTACQANERIIQVARYGRIYKRKSPWFQTREAHSNAPAGTRYCRMCGGFMPLSAFYTHIKRFVCRMHHAARVRHTELHRYSRDQSVAYAIEMWTALTDVKHMLGYMNVDYDIQDIRALVIHSGIPFSMNVRVMPVDPSLPMRPRNVAIVSRRSFDLIVQTYSHMCSRGLFIAQVQRCNLMPKHMDASWPEFPTHDKQYVRQDVDVGPLLAGELAMETFDCPDRDLIERLVQHEPGSAPWVAQRNHAPAVAIAFRARFVQHVARSRKTRKAASAAPPAAAAPRSSSGLEEEEEEDDNDET